MNDLSCAELVELVTMYLEGALPEAERRRFEAHLRVCHGCTHYLEQMRHTIRLTGLLSEEALMPAAKEALLRAFRDWKCHNQDESG
ncbi:MAG: zf-HC2 domain-containing protein [Chloroflexi bacterium]|nr:zf-HC2 domain-containing protein [Chloroflexota bacterium]